MPITMRNDPSAGAVFNAYAQVGRDRAKADREAAMAKAILGGIDTGVGLYSDIASRKAEMEQLQAEQDYQTQRDKIYRDFLAQEAGRKREHDLRLGFIDELGQRRQSDIDYQRELDLRARDFEADKLQTREKARYDVLGREAIVQDLSNEAAQIRGHLRTWRSNPEVAGDPQRYAELAGPAQQRLDSIMMELTQLSQPQEFGDTLPQNMAEVSPGVFAHNDAVSFFQVKPESGTTMSEPQARAAWNAYYQQIGDMEATYRTQFNQYMESVDDAVDAVFSSGGADRSKLKELGMVLYDPDPEHPDRYSTPTPTRDQVTAFMRRKEADRFPWNLDGGLYSPPTVLHNGAIIHNKDESAKDRMKQRYQLSPDPEPLTDVPPPGAMAAPPATEQQPMSTTAPSPEPAPPQQPQSPYPLAEQAMAAFEQGLGRRAIELDPGQIKADLDSLIIDFENVKPMDTFLTVDDLRFYRSNIDGNPDEVMALMQVQGVLDEFKRGRYEFDAKTVEFLEEQERLLRERINQP